MNDIANSLVSDLRKHRDQLWETRPVGVQILDKLPLSEKGKELVSSASSLLLENGVKHLCSVRTPGNPNNSEIISLSAIEFADLIHRLKEL